MTRLAATLFGTLLAVSTLVATQDLSGVWAGEFNITMNGETRPDVVHMVLKQSGTAITGTAGPNQDQQWPIVNGKIDGAKVTFQVKAEGGPGLVDFALTLADGHLKGQANANGDGRSFSAAVDVQRKVN
jgi:hypothetical protein